MSIRQSIPNLPAVYTIEEDLSSRSIYCDLSVWIARHEERMLGVFASKIRAMHACAWHESQQQCFEEA